LELASGTICLIQAKMADLEGMEPGVPGFCIINVERREGYKR